MSKWVKINAGSCACFSALLSLVSSISKSLSELCIFPIPILSSHSSAIIPAGFWPHLSFILFNFFLSAKIRNIVQTLLWSSCGQNRGRLEHTIPIYVDQLQPTTKSGLLYTPWKLRHTQVFRTIVVRLSLTIFSQGFFLHKMDTTRDMSRSKCCQICSKPFWTKLKNN